MDKMRSPIRFEELTAGLNPRPRVRSRIGTGRARIHTLDSIPSDQVHEEENPLELQDGESAS